MGEAEHRIACEWCQGQCGNDREHVGVLMHSATGADGGPSQATGEVKKHLTSVEVKVEKVLQEGREIAGVQGRMGGVTMQAGVAYGEIRVHDAETTKGTPEVMRGHALPRFFAAEAHGETGHPEADQNVQGSGAPKNGSPILLPQEVTADVGERLVSKQASPSESTRGR